MKAVEAPAVVQEGLEPGIAPALGGFDLADEDGVIASRIGVDGRALDLGERVLEDGKPDGALAVRGALELLGAARRGCEAAGQLLVIEVQDIDREAAVSVKGLVALGGVGHADQDEGRVEGNRRDGAGGETGGLACGIPRRDHGDAGSQVPQHTPKIVGSQHVLFVTVLG